MFQREPKCPHRSFFLFGPRGTGKATWLRHGLPGALWFDLLHTKTFLDLSRQPELFRHRTEALRRGSWVIVNEVPRMPALLNEIHTLISEHGFGFRFALTASSARRLKRLDLLEGRAINRQFFPLTAAELNFDFDVDHVLRFGLLPQIHVDPEHAPDILEAYLPNYLREEIQQEGLVRQLDSFVRFLQAASETNGRIANVAQIARHAAVARPTVQGYFETLIDTLMGFWLPAWQPEANVKEVAKAKFYLFDPGVARALAGRLKAPLDAGERGLLLETWALHELRAAIAFQNLNGELHYWRTPSGTEINFIWKRDQRAIGIQVKASSNWCPEFSKPLQSLIDAGTIQSGFGTYLGTEELKDDVVRILPWKLFLRELTAGNILATD